MPTVLLPRKNNRRRSMVQLARAFITVEVAQLYLRLAMLKSDLRAVKRKAARVSAK